MPQPIPLAAFKAARSIGQPCAAPELEATVLEWRRASAKRPKENSQVQALLAGLDGNGGCR